MTNTITQVLKIMGGSVPVESWRSFGKWRKMLQKLRRDYDMHLLAASVREAVPVNGAAAERQATYVGLAVSAFHAKTYSLCLLKLRSWK